MSSLNFWRTEHSLNIENACMLLAGLDPWDEDMSLKLVAYSAEKKQAEMPSLGIGWVDQKDIGKSEEDTIELEFDDSKEVKIARRQALIWLLRAKKAVANGELTPHGNVHSFDRKDARPVPLTQIDPGERLYFQVTRIELARWLVSLGWAKNELPGFLIGAEPVCSEGEAEELRALEVFGLLVDLYVSQHGPDYKRGNRPNASRVVKDMHGIMPKDITKMSDRKLKEHVGAAIAAWEAKKRR